jgi:hypothetical protein
VAMALPSAGISYSHSSSLAVAMLFGDN